jgi:hypothetical protein
MGCLPLPASAGAEVPSRPRSLSSWTARLSIFWLLWSSLSEWQKKATVRNVGAVWRADAECAASVKPLYQPWTVTWVPVWVGLAVVFVKRAIAGRSRWCLARRSCLGARS